jgi:hypothetical protein
MASDLNFKNKELTINLIALMKKNEMLTDISKIGTDRAGSKERGDTRGAFKDQS